MIAVIGLTWVPIGCHEGMHPGAPPTVTRITSLEKVTGQWEGKPQQVRLPDKREAGRIVLIIKDSGDYTFEDANSSDAGLGAGRFTIQDGKLVADTGKRVTTVTLYERDNAHFLVVDVAFTGGDRYSLEMRRVPPGVNPITSPKSPM